MIGRQPPFFNQFNLHLFSEVDLNMNDKSMRQVEVKQKELAWLRSQLTKTFLSSSGVVLYPTSYLKRYDQLSEDINNQLDPAKDEYVSQNLLRKLFYDTNEDVSAIFRIAFIDACYRYLSGGKHNRGEYRKFSKRSARIRLTFISGLAMLALAVSLYKTTSSPLAPESFRDDFGHDSTGLVLQEGWYIANLDTAYWNRPDLNNHLTLFTQQGDNWVSPGQEPEIKNLLLREIGPGDFTATILLSGFRPTSNWQQAGILLIQDDDNSIRVTYGYDDVGAKKPRLVVQTVPIVDGMVLHPHTLTERPLTEQKVYPRKIWLRMIREDNMYRFYYKKNFYNERWIFTRAWNAPDSFSPSQIGIGAFQGITQELFSGEIIQLDREPIPANIDFFEIETASSTESLIQ